MSSNGVSLKLTSAQALVLFEWLCRFDDDKAGDARFELNSAERKVLWLLEGQLESTLLEPLDPDYKRRLLEARREVGEEFGTDE